MTNFRGRLLSIFRRGRKIAKSKYELRLVCLSARLYRKTRLPLDGFSLNFIFEYFSKIRRKNQVSLKSDKNNGYFT